jgi:hypothetical protein
MIRMNNSANIRNTGAYIALGILFVSVSAYFYLAGSYILVFQETRSLFVFSGEYLHKFLLKPGGLLEYAAKFLTQFYTDSFSGPLVISAILTIPAVILYFINKRLIPGITYSLLFLLIPSFLLLLMQANYYHMMEYNLGFLVVLAYYLFMISSEKRFHRILVLILFPLFYYLAGAYAMIFASLYIVHNLLYVKGKMKSVFPLLLMISAVLSFLIAWKILFLQTVEQLIFYPLPAFANPAYKVTFFILTAYIVFYPSISRVTGRLKMSRLNKKSYSYITIGIVFALTAIFLFRIYNPQTARVIELERLVFAEEWNKAIELHEQKPSRNLIGQYFYNIALSETDQLCERLFTGSQDFAAGTLVLPWGDDHLDRGAYFYYSIGLINEAHRWAYEEMVVYGNRPQNIKLLARTSLINGDYEMAKKYLNILKKTIYYRGWAKKYEAMSDNPDLIKADPDLGAKTVLLPKTSFFIQFNEPQNNIPLMLEGQSDNRKAIDYYMAGLLLTKQVEIIVNNVKSLKSAGYDHIPRHIEEAVLIYYNSTKTLPDLGGLIINPATQDHFNQYFSAYVNERKNQATLKENMQKQFGNTFWYYFHFK